MGYSDPNFLLRSSIISPVLTEMGAMCCMILVPTKIGVPGELLHIVNSYKYTLKVRVFCNLLQVILECDKDFR